MSKRPRVTTAIPNKTKNKAGNGIFAPGKKPAKRTGKTS